MNISWNLIWEAHPDIFIAQNWQVCPEEKRRAFRLPTQFAYYMGGETSLRVGIVACSSVSREDEFLLAGILWGNRLSNGAKTVIYFVAPNFSPYFLNALSKIAGNISARAVYWREKLTPSLYLIPEEQPNSRSRYAMGEERPDLKRWGLGLNPVARHQLVIVNTFFGRLASRKVRIVLKPQHIDFIWGHFEIAELRRKGKKFELSTKVKCLRHIENASQWQKQGWVDASGALNQEFCTAILQILDVLETQEQEGSLRLQEVLPLWLHHGEGVIKSVWGSPWGWPWLPKDRGESAVIELGEWYYFQANGQLSVVCPIFDKPLSRASQSILFSSILERSMLLMKAKDDEGHPLLWDGRIHWLTSLGLAEDLRRWYCWLKHVDDFPIWTIPEDWQEKGIYALNSQNISSTAFIMQSVN